MTKEFPLRRVLSTRTNWFRVKDEEEYNNWLRCLSFKNKKARNVSIITKKKLEGNGIVYYSFSAKGELEWTPPKDQLPEDFSTQDSLELLKDNLQDDSTCIVQEESITGVRITTITHQGIEWHQHHFD